MTETFSQPDCIFCKITKRQIEAVIIEESDSYLAIRDINPQAPTHILIIPKEHYADITALTDPELTGKLFQAAAAIASRQGLKDGFRLVVNNGVRAGQTVDHLHIHLLGGRQLTWPPG